ncbi:MAG: RsmB/NOP family class I SAM-dependent RNA methyltransferase [Promethearchaeota archaeon]
MRKNTTVVHYYNEIIRFWNKINYIVRKSLKGSKSFDNTDIPKYFYATYRILWEHATEKAVIKELREFDIRFLKNIRNFSLEKALVNKKDKEKISILEAIPSFMIDQLLPVMNTEFLVENLQFMNGLHIPLEITLRVNTLITNLNPMEMLAVIEEDFKKKGINYHKDNHLPNLFWIPRTEKGKVIRSKFYQNGSLLFQDKASVAVIQFLAPNKKEKICDLCAAPGIKTSLISQYLNNTGNIIAGEFLSKRAIAMRYLLTQLNVLNVHLVNTDSIDFPVRYQKYFDKILLDAPCTGSGAFLTSPELKWRQNEKFLHQNVLLQEKLLQSAIDLLKPGGIIVYSTCSLYPEEGEYQINKYIDKLESMKLPDWTDKGYKIDGMLIPGTARLFPAKHHTEGFFIAKFKKK